MANLAILASQVKSIDGEIVNGVLGATSTAGMLVYQDEDDDYFYPGNANQTSNGPAKVVGVLLASGVSGQGCPIQIDGIIDLGAQAAPVVGTTYVLSGTDGAWAPIADQVTGWWCVLSGVANESNQMHLILQNFSIRKP